MGTSGKFEHEDSAQNGVNRLDNELNSDNNIGSILAYQTTDADTSFSLVAHIMVVGDKGPRCGPWGRLSDPRHGPLRSPWPHCPSLLKSYQVRCS